MSKPKDPNKCEWSGCKGKPVWHVTKLWGKGGVMYCCAEHKPGSKRTASSPPPGTWYDIKPIGEADAK